jgi:hypothetical protein
LLGASKVCGLFITPYFINNAGRLTVEYVDNLGQLNKSFGNLLSATDPLVSELYRFALIVPKDVIESIDNIIIIKILENIEDLTVLVTADSKTVHYNTISVKKTSFYLVQKKIVNINGSECELFFLEPGEEARGLTPHVMSMNIIRFEEFISNYHVV